jgi:hypothetical protein
MMTVARSAIPETTKVHSSGMGKKTENQTAISEITMSRIMTRISLFFIPKSNHGAPRVVQSAATLGVEDQLVLIVFIPEESQSGLSRTIDGSYLPLPALKVTFELSIAGGQFGLSTAGNWEPSG